MRRYQKTIVFALSLLPFAILCYQGLSKRLSANPIEDITHFTGDWALYFLLITLSINPLRTITGINEFIRFRRMLGLFAFFYACLHFTTYILLDQFFDWNAIIEDIIERPYITAGFTAFLLLIPLAATSNRSMVMRLGPRWAQLHKLIYVITALGLLHYYWMVKADIRTPVTLAAVFAGLMILRLEWVRKLRKLLIFRDK